jgi:hypothetical protein
LSFRRSGGFSHRPIAHIEALFVMPKSQSLGSSASHSDMEYASGPSANLTAQDQGDAGRSEKCTHGLVDGLTAACD